MPDALTAQLYPVPTVAPLGVTLSHARLAYHGSPLFENLTVDLPAGTWTAVLGPSGSGKTSLLRMILGLGCGGDASGVVTCSDGRHLTGRASMMAQHDHLFPWLTAIENVLIGPRLRGEGRKPAAVARGRALLAAVGLGDAADVRPAALSGGMRQRVALARTLMEGRPVVLMDEPFSAVDAITRLRLQGLAATLLAGCTVLLVTHDPLEALCLADRIVILSGRPARLHPILVPDLPRPRRVDDPAVLDWQGRLLNMLAAAA